MSKLTIELINKVAAEQVPTQQAPYNPGRSPWDQSHYGDDPNGSTAQGGHYGAIAGGVLGAGLVGGGTAAVKGVLQSKTMGQAISQGAAQNAQKARQFNTQNGFTPEHAFHNNTNFIKEHEKLTDLVKSKTPSWKRVAFNTVVGGLGGAALGEGIGSLGGAAYDAIRGKGPN